MVSCNFGEVIVMIWRGDSDASLMTAESSIQAVRHPDTRRGKGTAVSRNCQTHCLG